MGENIRAVLELDAAQGDSPTDVTLTSSVEPASETPWCFQDLLRRHALGLHLIPLRGKRPLVRGRHGEHDYIHQQPTLDDPHQWMDLGPEGWAVPCGGPARVVVLEVEAAGWNHPRAKRMGIRRIVDSLPDTYIRRSPSGVHAVFRILNDPAPHGRGGRPPEQSAEHSDGPIQLAELRAEGQYAGILSLGRGPLPASFCPHGVTVAELNELLTELRSLSGVPRPLPADGLAAGRVETQGSPSWLQLRPPSEPCAAVLRVADSAAKRLAEDKLTPAALAPVLRLVCMAKQGDACAAMTASAGVSQSDRAPMAYQGRG